MRTFFFVAIGCLLLLPANAQTINSFSVMPANSTVIYPNFLARTDANSFLSQLTANNVSIEVWDRNTDGWLNGYLGCCGGVSGFSPPNLTAANAPFNGNLIDDAVRLTFGNPISAFGATFFATDNPPFDDPCTSFDNNEENTSYSVQAFAADGTVIGVAHSSSWDVRYGPVDIYVGGCIQFIASFAGISSTVPIHQIVISGTRPTDGAKLASFSNLYFTPWPPYKASVQPPINAEGSSVFPAKRGVVPVKFTLTQNDVPTCALPTAKIAVTRTAGSTVGPIDENSYVATADSGSDFRIDPTDCQYVYNLPVSALGVGTYGVDITINGIAVGHAVFALK